MSRNKNKQTGNITQIDSNDNPIVAKAVHLIVFQITLLDTAQVADVNLLCLPKITDVLILVHGHSTVPKSKPCSRAQKVYFAGSSRS